MYIARPPSGGSRHRVVVGHQLFGVDAPVRAFADRLAAAGCLVAVPDLYHRTAPGIELAQDDAGRARGFELLHGLDRDEVVADVAAAVDALGGDPARVGMVGLSMGGHVAYLAAARLGLAATAVLYPGWLTGGDIALSRPEPTVTLTPAITGRLLFLVGADDHVVPPADVATVGAALRDAGVRHEIVVYPDTPHAFLLPGGPTYRPGPATDAWRRILELVTS
ncbi:dienelactone hydrolase family protein [Dactylosporangium aurantiacum]|uniref:Dienelactone hydrolase family protein n=1 Tax=Dactylosporangium aurantiacum TaxID=35754 RepID=A0A9Q9INS6_9ACTN|nr:dienelactone hydrolase family protein [Dactylosporangium aurantiacum]MDG6105527.1 dienelactone hydrolase family protein [Dactylosporangium aurantiacum]UWZ57127.1 dienelactone hydrolase family protein [Dactylosporangium aurantiacum]